MFGSSIYLRDREAFTGGSPQAVFEDLWQQDRKGRLRTRAIIAAVALLLGGYVVAPLFGVALAVVAASADALHHWWRYTSTSVWRKGLRGEERMTKLLRFTLERRGYRVLHARHVPGYGTADQILFGPTGVWLIDNRAWHPETELLAYGGKLFIDDRTPSKYVRELTGSAQTIAGLLSESLGKMVTVTPVLAVHGGKLRKGRLIADGITLLRPLKLRRWTARHPTADYTQGEVEELLRAAVYALPINAARAPLAQA